MKHDKPESCLFLLLISVLIEVKCEKLQRLRIFIHATYLCFVNLALMLNVTKDDRCAMTRFYYKTEDLAQTESVFCTKYITFIFGSLSSFRVLY